MVQRLYRNLERDGDPAGVDFWLGQLISGALNGPQVLAEFTDSTENVIRTDTQPPLSTGQAEIFRLYQAVFGRTPDAEGYCYWTSLRDDGQSLGFPRSSHERQRGVPASLRISTNCGDPGGSHLSQRARSGRGSRRDRLWIDRLRNGLSTAELLVAFADSPENMQRTGTYSPLRLAVRGSGFRYATKGPFPSAPGAVVAGNVGERYRVAIDNHRVPNACFRDTTQRASLSRERGRPHSGS